MELIDYAALTIIDTCFCPLPDGGAVWFPPAFDEYGQHAIREHLPGAELKSHIGGEEAAHFFFRRRRARSRYRSFRKAHQNMVVARLRDRGCACRSLPMTEFLKAGGACKCLTMFLPQRERC